MTPQDEKKKKRSTPPHIPQGKVPQGQVPRGRVVHNTIPTGQIDVSPPSGTVVVCTKCGTGLIWQPSLGQYYCPRCMVYFDP